MSFENLSGKRLLVMGSTPLVAELIKKAQSMGIVVGAVDYNPLEESYGKQIADEHYEISLAETDAIAQLVKEKNFDGVLTAFIDSYLPFYVEVCEKTGFPCYLGERQLELATDKATFRQACIDAGVPVIPGGQAKSFEEAQALADELVYPLMLKPADNSGSRGVIECEGPDHLRESFDYALSFSGSGTVIVEKYMTCPSIGMSYFLNDGEAYLTSTCDRGMYIAEETGSAIAGSLHYPSRFTKQYMDDMDLPVKRLLSDNGFTSGVVSLQAFADGESFYFCEMCYRPSGGKHYVFIEDQTGSDELGCFIEFSLTGASASYDPKLANPVFPQGCHVGKIQGVEGGIVSQMSGKEQIDADPRVLSCTTVFKPGGTIGVKATTAQTLLTVWYKTPEDEEPGELFRSITSPFQVTDAQGRSLIDSYQA